MQSIRGRVALQVEQRRVKETFSCDFVSVFQRSSPHLGPVKQCAFSALTLMDFLKTILINYLLPTFWEALLMNVH